MFDPRLALEPFDLRSLLNLSQPLEAKDVGILVSEDPCAERRLLGYVCEIQGQLGRQYVGDQYLVRIHEHDFEKPVEIFLTTAQKLLAPASHKINPYTGLQQSYRLNDLELDMSGTFLPDPLRTVIQNAICPRYTTSEFIIR